MERGVRTKTSRSGADGVGPLANQAQHQLAAIGNYPSTRAAVVTLCKELVAQGMEPQGTEAQYLQD